MWDYITHDPNTIILILCLFYGTCNTQRRTYRIPSPLLQNIQIISSFFMSDIKVKGVKIICPLVYFKYFGMKSFFEVSLNFSILMNASLIISHTNVNLQSTLPGYLRMQRAYSTLGSLMKEFKKRGKATQVCWKSWMRTERSAPRNMPEATHPLSALESRIMLKPMPRTDCRVKRNMHTPTHNVAAYWLLTYLHA